jgi:hypothetical protein
MFGRKTPTTSEVAAELPSFAPARPVTLVKESGPAVSRMTVQAESELLTLKFDKAGIALSKTGLDGIRAEAALILDHSGSMKSDYRSGRVQTLVERALAFALRIDGDGYIPVIPFDSVLWPTVPVTLRNHTDVVNREIYQPYRMGGTYLAPALDLVLKMVREADGPMFVIIVTDDDPTDTREVVALLAELKRWPVFLKVLTLAEAPFWKGMDDIEIPGLIDNLDTKPIEDPAGISDLAFAEAMVDEWDTWVEAALSVGILRHP